MKRFLLPLFLVLLLACPVFGATIKDENFATGYGWTEQSTGGASNPTENTSISGLSPPTQCGSVGLYAHAPSASQGTRAYYQHSSNLTISYIEHHIYISAESFSNGQGGCVLATRTLSGAANVTMLNVEQDSGGSLVWRYTDAGGTTDFGSWQTGKWYMIQEKLDTVANTLDYSVYEYDGADWSLNASSSGSYTSSNLPRQIMVGSGIIASAYSDNLLTTYHGRTFWSNSEFLTDMSEPDPIERSTYAISSLANFTGVGSVWHTGGTYSTWSDLAKGSGADGYVYDADDDDVGDAQFTASDLSGETIYAVRLCFMAQQRTDATHRMFEVGPYISSTFYPNGKVGIEPSTAADSRQALDSHNFEVTASSEYYVAEWELNPSDGAAWEASDLSSGLWFRFHDPASDFITDAAPGGQVSEMWMEVIHGPGTEGDAYLTHAPWVTHATTTTAQVKCRASGATDIGISYGTVEATVKAASSSDSDESVTSATDYIATFNLTGLSANTKYFYKIWVNDIDVYEFEEGDTDANSFWYNLPYFYTAPSSGTFDFVVIGDKHGAPENYQIANSLMSVADTDVRLVLDVGDIHGAHSDVLDLQTQYGTYRASPLNNLTQAVKWRQGWTLPNRHFWENVLSKTVFDHVTWSDHDYVGDNSTKDGRIPRGQQRDGGILTWRMQQTGYQDFGSQIDIDVSNTSYAHPDSGTYGQTYWSTIAVNQRLYINTDDFIIQIEDPYGDGSAHDGFYVGKVLYEEGTTPLSVIGITPYLSGSDENHVGTGNLDCSPSDIQINFFQYRTFNTLASHKQWWYDGQESPDDYTGTATGTDTDTLADTTSAERQFEYKSLSGGTPAVDDDITIGGDGATLLYVDATDGTTGTMVVLMDTDTDVIADEDTITDGVWTATLETAVVGIYNFPTESNYGVYPGMVVIHSSASDMMTDPAFSYIDENYGTYCELYRALGPAESFGSGDYYLIKRSGLWRSFDWGDAHYTVTDFRYKSDIEAIQGKGYPGCDPFDGVAEGVTPKKTGTADQDIYGCLADNGTNFLSLSDHNLYTSVVQGDVVCNTDYWRFTTCTISGTFSEPEAVTWDSGSSTGTLMEVGTDDKGDPELAIITTDTIRPGDLITNGSATAYVHGDLRNVCAVVVSVTTTTSSNDTLVLEAEWGTGTAIDLFPDGDEGYFVRESGGSIHGDDARDDENIRFGHVQRTWVLQDNYNSSKSWRFLLGETPWFGLKQDKPGNQYQLWETIDPLDCMLNLLMDADNGFVSRYSFTIGADQHFAGLDDGSQSEPPYPMANVAPYFCYYGDGYVHVPGDNAWFVWDGGDERYEWAALGRDDNNDIETDGAFGLFELQTGGYLDVSLRGPGGSVLNNADMDMDSSPYLLGDLEMTIFYPGASIWRGFGANIFESGVFR